MSLTALTERNVRAWAALLELKSAESPVRYLAVDGETIVSGTLRSGWFTQAGEPDDEQVPFVERFVRVTTLTGGERYEPFARMADLLATGQLAVRR